jgi:hypothetical protein
MKNEFGTFDYYVQDHIRLINRVTKYQKRLGLSPWQRAVISSFVDRAYCMGGDFAGAMMFLDLKKERERNKAGKNKAIIIIERRGNNTLEIKVQPGKLNNNELLEIAEHLKQYLNEKSNSNINR